MNGKGGDSIDNSSLNRAKVVKDDEFYTTYGDIEAELPYYSREFAGKIVYCNTDNVESQFVQYFLRNFAQLNISKLIATYYNKNESYVLVSNKSGTEMIKDRKLADGDYSSNECIEILHECDILVTNPPFSIFRSFLPTIIDSGKKFLVIGNMNVLTSRPVFPYFKNDKVWLGKTKPRMYTTPDGKLLRFGNTCWYTNMMPNSGYSELVLTKTYDPQQYTFFDNYNAININHTKDIPKDYTDVMGVPISFLNKYCPDQYNIIAPTDGCSDYGIGPSRVYINPIQHRPDGSLENGSKANSFATLKTEPIGFYYTADNIDYPVKGVYKRLLIRRI